MLNFRDSGGLQQPTTLNYNLNADGLIAFGSSKTAGLVSEFAG